MSTGQISEPDSEKLLKKQQIATKYKMTQSDYRISLINETRESSFHCFGYQYIFDKRAIHYNKLVNWLKVLGILVPALLGTLVITYNTNETIKSISIATLSVVTVIQFGFSVLAIIYKWDDELSYSYEASQSYNSLYRRFKNLANFPPIDDNELKKQFDLLDTENNARGQQDSKHNLKEAELRMGMRSSLREHQRKCVGCALIPKSMKSSECDVCGNF